MSPCAAGSIRTVSLALVVVLAAIAGPALALHPRVELPELAHTADVIFVGTVQSLSSRVVDDGRMVMTDVHFGDLEIVSRKEHVPEDLSQGITLTLAGGEADGLYVSVSEVPRFAVGDRVCLFARMDGTVYANPLVAGVQGLFRVKRDPVTGVEYPFTNGNAAITSTEGGRLRLLQRVDRIEGGRVVRLPGSRPRNPSPRPASETDSASPSRSTEASRVLTLPEFTAGVRATLAGPPPARPRLIMASGGVALLGHQPASPGSAVGMPTSGIPAVPRGLESLGRSRAMSAPASTGAVQAAASSDTVVDLCRCGHKNLHADMEQVPTSFWSWQHNNNAMWMYNQFMDVYRYHASDGTVFLNGYSEFCGFLDDDAVHTAYTFHWGDYLGMCVTTGAPCLAIIESDIMFNPAYSWWEEASDTIGRDDRVLYRPCLMHELGHSWGLMRGNCDETYHYPDPSVMHAYYHDIVEDGWGIHPYDAGAIRDTYDDQTSIITITDLGVESYYADSDGHLSNSTTDKTDYTIGDVLTVSNFSVENMSHTPTPDVRLRFYLSLDTSITDSDYQMGGYWSWWRMDGESYEVNDYTMAVPTVPTGTYYVGAIVTINGDSYDYDDFNRNNRTYLYSTINVTCPQPDDPSSVSASDGTSTSYVRVTWTGSPLATRYDVYRGTTSNAAAAALLAPSLTTTTYNDTSAGLGTLYYYWIVAWNDNCGNHTDRCGGNVGHRATPAPTDVAATDGTRTDDVRITWTAVDGATHYRVYRNTTLSSSGSTPLGSWQTTTSYNDATAGPGQDYYYWIRAATSVSGGYQSAYSSSDAGWRALLPPEDLEASSRTYTDYVRLTWNTSLGATHYRVYRNTSAIMTTSVPVSDWITGTSFNDTDTVADDAYYYWVRAAVSSAGYHMSGYSDMDIGRRSLDCNGNHVPDGTDIAVGTSADCNTNAVPDECEVAGGTEPDCNQNGVPDSCDLVMHFSMSAGGLYRSGVSPISIAAGDFNSDGKMDLVTTDDPANTMTVLIGSGDGTFPSSTSYAFASSLGTVVTGDFNGDHKTDVALAATSSNTLQVLINTGTGGFAPPVSYAVASGPYGLAAGKLDADGDIDLVVTKTTSNQITVLMNNGSGVFAAKATYTVGSVPVAAVIASLDATDGVDLAVANSVSANVTILRNLGDGTFATKGTYAAGLEPRAIRAADFDADGDVDLVVANPSMGAVSVLINDGTGDFGTRRIFGVGASPQDVAVADFDKDGDLDIATANRNADTVSLLLNNGPAVFTRFADYPTGGGPCALVARNFNVDDVPDLAVGQTNPNGIQMLLNTTVFPVSPDCNANGVPDICEPDCNANQIADSCDITAGTSTDCDADGVPDECQPDCNNNGIADTCDIADGTSQDCTGNGVPDECEDDCNHNGIADACDVEYTLAFANAVYNSAGKGACDLAAGDVDADGDVDLVSADYTDNTVSVLKGSGHGAFGHAAHYAAGTAPSSALLLELTGDKTPDLVVTNAAADTVSILNNDGSGGFAVKAQYAVGPAGTSHSPSDVAAGDLDGDGGADLVVANAKSNTIALLQNLGKAGFGTAVLKAVGDQPVAVVVADLDGDKDLDIAVANYGDNTVSVLMNITSGLAAPVNYVVGTNPSSLVVADINGDRRLDLVVTCTGASAVVILVNNGGGTFAKGGTLHAPGTLKGVIAADLDRDGDLDVATTESTTGKLLVFRNLGHGTFMPPLSFPAGLHSWALAAATLNTDSSPDVVVVEGNSLAGAVSVLLNTSGPPFSRDCDGNGVPDECQLAADSDGDGWLDACDDCPNTIPGMAVDEHGCPPVIPGDFDRDGDVDVADFAVFQSCWSGPAILRTSGCLEADFGDDKDVDQSDFGIFQRCYSGENKPGAPACAN